MGSILNSFQDFNRPFETEQHQQAAAVVAITEQPRRVISPSEPFGPNMHGFNMNFVQARLLKSYYQMDVRVDPTIDTTLVAYQDAENTRGLGRPVWSQRWDAKVMHDHLYLRATHVADQATLGLATAGEFRRRADGRNYRLCNHVLVGHASRYPSGGHELARPRGERRLEWFKECWQAEGACDLCLTDWHTTVERIEGGTWRVTITVFHRLGRCGLAPDSDWNHVVRGGWEIVPEGADPSFAWNIRRWLDAPPGSIMRAWVIGRWYRREEH